MPENTTQCLIYRSWQRVVTPDESLPCAEDEITSICHGSHGLVDIRLSFWKRRNHSKTSRHLTDRLTFPHNTTEGKMDKPQIISHVMKSLNFTLFDVKWIPCSAKFVVLGNHPRGTGALNVYELSHADLKPVLEVM